MIHEYKACICPQLGKKGRESIDLPKRATDFAAVTHGGKTWLVMEGVFGFWFVVFFPSLTFYVSTVTLV